MHRRTGTALGLALLIAAVPTIVSLCELRCVAAEAAPASDAAPACAGHDARKSGEPSPGAHDDCAGHVLLAKGGTIRIALRLDPGVAEALPSGSSFVALDPQRGRVITGSADLSPPAGRRPDILRL